jgi:hypothetical protein
MNQYKFSRAAAIISNTYFKKYEERYAFAQACDRAISLNPDNPLEVLDPAYQKYFTEEVRVHPKAQAAQNILRHLPGKHAQKSHGGGRGGGISKLTAGKAAQQVFEKATALEPQITKQVQDLATANGAELIGLKNRLKTVESLERKIGDKARDEFGGDNQAAAADIGDSIRYTMQLDEQSYAGGVKNTIDVLNQEGYKTNVKNYWQENNIYKGVNVTVTSPEGQKFELQFHTPGSYSLKETKNNDLYQIHRLSTTPLAMKYELEQQMANNWVNVQTPSNLDLLATISRPVLQPPSQRLD